jgi:(p)ppGpp synthase/HD superfamily hydrolase
MPDPIKKQLDERQLLKLAHTIATEAHKGQKRKDGKPYITHPEAVAQIVDQDFFSLLPDNTPARQNWSPLKNYVIMAAFLHDTIEDTYVTSERLRNEGFPEMVIDIVKTVTKQPGENYFEFTMRIMESGNVGAKIVKLADLRHNMSDLAEGSMLDKYRFATYILSYFNHR